MIIMILIHATTTLLLQDAMNYLNLYGTITLLILFDPRIYCLEGSFSSTDRHFDDFDKQEFLSKEVEGSFSSTNRHFDDFDKQEFLSKEDEGSDTTFHYDHFGRDEFISSELEGPFSTAVYSDDFASREKNGSERCISKQYILKPHIVHPTENHTGTIFFLHSHSQTGPGWAFLTEELVPQPYMKMVFPSSNIMSLEFLEKANMPTWFDFSGTKYPEINANSTAGINKTTRYVHHLLHEEIKSGIPPERIILSGFGQGAALALHAALSFPKSLAGIILCSPWEPFPETLEKSFNKVNKDIPILHCRVDSDIFTPPESGPRTYELLKKHVSNRVDYRNYTGKLMYTIEEFSDMNTFCKDRLPPIHKDPI